MIGKGAHGKVFLTEYKGNQFALKIIRKDLLIEKQRVPHTLNEKRILSELNHPFITKMKYCF